MKFPSFGRRAHSISACAFLLVATTLPASAAQYDLVIRNGRVMDGSGKPAVLADVAIDGGKVAVVGQVPAGAGTREIDATGKAVAPGFIDVHTHVDDDVLKSPLAENFVRDGVTTIVSGNCGGSVRDVGALFAKLREQGAAVNVATLYGHNTVLREVKGDRKGELTAEQMTRARELVAKAMREGAVGLSTGLIYNPGQFSPTEEIVELAKVVGEFKGIYATHMRSEGSGIFEAIDEAVRIAREAGVRAQISHFKLPADAARKVGGSEATLGRVLAARQAGLELWLDQYPYTASSTSISTLLPDPFLEEGIEKARERLKDPEQFERVLRLMHERQTKLGRTSLGYAVVAYSATLPQYNGKNVVQIAQMMKLKAEKGESAELVAEPGEAKLPAVSLEEQCRAVLEVFKAGNASCVFHTMAEPEVENIMRSPIVAVASDSGLREFGVGMPHPRGYGTNTRVLGRYAREKKLFSMEEAVRKMTSLPALAFRFLDRGIIKAGYVADVVVFDPETVIDKATFEQPHQYPEGIEWVVVNGVVVMEGGKMTGSKPGKPVLGPGATK